MVDVRVFYPFAPSYRNQSLATTMKTMENQKKRKCNERILYGKNGSLTPLVFITNGGMSTETKQFHRRLSQLLCEKSDVSYGGTSAWIKRQIRFSLLQTSIICIRGLRSKKHNIPTGERMDIVCVCICVYIYVYGCILIYVCIYIIYIRVCKKSSLSYCNYYHY